MHITQSQTVLIATHLCQLKQSTSYYCRNRASDAPQEQILQRLLAATSQSPNAPRLEARNWRRWVLGVEVYQKWGMELNYSVAGITLVAQNSVGEQQSSCQHHVKASLAPPSRSNGRCIMHLSSWARFIGHPAHANPLKVETTLMFTYRIKF